jgi:hypothetical protein
MHRAAAVHIADQAAVAADQQANVADAAGGAADADVVDVADTLSHQPCQSAHIARAVDGHITERQVADGAGVDARKQADIGLAGTVDAEAGYGVAAAIEHAGVAGAGQRHERAAPAPLVLASISLFSTIGVAGPSVAAPCKP